MYSRRVRFTAAAAGLCLTVTVRSCVLLLINMADDYGYSVGRLLRQDQFWLGLITAGAGILFGIIAMHFARVERRLEQKQRDRIAERLVAKIEGQIASQDADSEIQPFALYLRPFGLEKAIRKWRIGLTGFKTFFLETDKVNFEHFLVEIFNSLDLVLISFGFHDGQVGAGRVNTSDIEWIDRFRKLADRATAIVVVPGSQPGIIEEIRWLRERNLLAKTIFFKPRWYPRVAWQKMAQFYEDEGGIKFPAFSPKQIAFRVDSDGKCHEITWWRTGLWRRVSARQMRALLDPL